MIQSKIKFYPENKTSSVSCRCCIVVDLENLIKYFYEDGAKDTVVVFQGGDSITINEPFDDFLEKVKFNNLNVSWE